MINGKDDKNFNYSLWVSIVFAVLTHAVLLYFLKLTPQPITQTTTPVLTVMLSKSLATNAKDLPHKTTNETDHHSSLEKSSKKLMSFSDTSNAHQLANPPDNLQHQIETAIQSKSNNGIQRSDTESKALVIPSQQQPIINRQQILEIASQVARDEGRLIEKEASQSNSNQPNTDSIYSNAIGKAFRHQEDQSQQKVRQLADGMIEVKTAFGTRYCLIPPKNFESSGC